MSEIGSRPKGRKVPDEQIIEAIKTETNIRQVLIKVGLVPKGANYMRVAKLLETVKV